MNPVLVVATHNLKKGGEMITLLSDLLPGVTIQTLADFPPAAEPEETGATYAENAKIKAEAAAAHTGELCIADDAGLEVDAMGGEPGIYSKRFAGEETPFPHKMQVILERLAGVEGDARSARFRCCVAIAAHGLETLVFERTCEGIIAHESSGAGGFGYDPIFFLPERGCTMADLTAAEKHQISHRGKVLPVAAEAIRGILALAPSVP
ncbi:MAG: RdgB/HAM1 family non-canonical purine NTP pyrophosphatase [Chthonomonas sp.]|nr:RdgB/HAM1 family non-canonical purine NTP pyrophosphatase [Chthonomonas sp.]